MVRTKSGMGGAEKITRGYCPGEEMHEPAVYPTCGDSVTRECERPRAPGPFLIRQLFTSSPSICDGCPLPGPRRGNTGAEDLRGAISPRLGVERSGKSPGEETRGQMLKHLEGH